MPKAAICDIYRTILEVLPPPADAAERWDALWQNHFATEPPSLDSLTARTREFIAADHAAAKALGIPHPEINWSDVMTRTAPELKNLPPAPLAAFLREHARIQRTTRLMPGAAAFLRTAHKRGIPLGIASNAQPYTLGELDEALAEADLSRAIFDPDLTLWSFELGFSKPDPHIFRILTARLALRGIAPPEILMLGDREDNDLGPAKACGWKTQKITTAQDWQSALNQLT